MKPLISKQEAEKSAKKYAELFVSPIETLSDTEIKGYAEKDFISGIEAANTKYTNEIIPVLENCREALIRSKSQITHLNKFTDFGSESSQIILANIESALQYTKELIEE